MGKRKITVTEPASVRIAEVAWFIESKGLLLTAEKFVDDVYDFLEKEANLMKVHATCRDPTRASLGYKCVVFKKKYTIVFVETDLELFVCEFLPSKNIFW